MSDRKLVLLLNSNQEYIRHLQEEDVKKYAPEINRFFEAITNTYIPLLNMMENLEKDCIPYKIQMVMPPVLCTLLEDTVVQGQYVSWLDRAIAFGEQEVKRVSKNKKLQELAQTVLEKYIKTKSDFTERYAMSLVPQFSAHQKSGGLELMASCGTSIYLPFYKDMKEIMSAQIETGLLSHKHFFGEIPDGFWLPELGYASGIEDVVRSYGYNYTILDARSTLLGETLPENGIFYPCRFNNSLVAFTAQKNIDGMIFGEDGYAMKPVYRNENRDAAFDLPAKNLSSFFEAGSARYASG